MSHMTAVMSYMTAVISHMTAITKTQHPIKAIKNFRLDRYLGLRGTLALLMGPSGRCNSMRAPIFLQFESGSGLDKTLNSVYEV